MKHYGSEGQSTRGRKSTHGQHDAALEDGDDSGRGAGVGFGGPGGRRQAAWAEAIEPVLDAKGIRVKQLRRTQGEDLY